MLKENKSFYIINLIKKLLVIPLVIIGLVGTGILVSLYYNIRFQNELVYFITGKLSLFPMVFIVSLIVYVLLKWTKPAESKIEQKVALIGVLIGLVLGTLSLFTFEKYTLTGITSYSLFGEYHYDFKDVSIFNVTDGFDDVLKIEFEMNDGKKYIFTGGFLEGVSHESKSIDDYYIDDPYKEYIIEITEILKSENIPINIRSIEEFEEYLDYDYWIEVAKMITEIYE